MSYKTGQRSDVDSVRYPVQVIGSVGSSKKKDSGKDEFILAKGSMSLVKHWSPFDSAQGEHEISFPLCAVEAFLK